MQFKVTPKRRLATCKDGRIIREYIIDPPLDQEFIDFLSSIDHISITEIGNLTFYRIEWIPEVMIKGMVQDPILYVYHPSKYTEKIGIYLDLLLSCYERKDPDGAKDASSVLKEVK